MQSSSAVPISPETVSQAGAGALLLGVAVVELWLAFWAAGWWHRSGALVFAVVGAVLLARAVAAVALRPRARLAPRALRPASAPAAKAAVRGGLTEAAQA